MLTTGYALIGAGCPEQDHWAPFADGGIAGPDVPDDGEESSGPPSQVPEGLPEDVKYPGWEAAFSQFLTFENEIDLPESEEPETIKGGRTRASRRLHGRATPRTLPHRHQRPLADPLNLQV